MLLLKKGECILVWCLSFDRSALVTLIGALTHNGVYSSDNTALIFSDTLKHSYHVKVCIGIMLNKETMHPEFTKQVPIEKYYYSER